MKRSQVRIRWRAARERFRGSLFYVPALYVMGTVLVAWATTWFDRRYAGELPSIPLLLPTTVDSARAILSTIAAATITVAGVVFSLTVIAVQLASSQFSPRVLRGFLRDRFSQRVIGIVMSTFTYCLLVLAATPTPTLPPQTVQNISVTIALALSVVAVLAIVAFLDHSARSMQVGEVIQRSTAETRALITEQLLERDEGVGADASSTWTRPDGRPAEVTSRSEGWVQQIDDRALLSALPAGGRVHVHVRVGSYVTPATLLAEVWVDDPDDDGDSLASDVRQAVRTGNERTMQEDLSFGIRQLVDIALRALSTGINDPTTAIEVIYRLGGLIEAILVRDLPTRVTSDDDGRRVVRTAELDHDRLIRYAFRQIRVAGHDQPAVIGKLVQVLGELHAHAQRRGLQERAAQLREEALLAVADLEAHVPLDEDVEPVRRTARGFGLL